MKRIEIREAFSLPDLSKELDEDREDRSGLGEWLRQCFRAALDGNFLRSLPFRLFLPSRV